MPESLKPLTDGINALTAYANEVTGESDTTLSEAVHTLADGYGQGGGEITQGIEIVTDANGKLTDYIFHGVEAIPPYAFNYLFYSPNVSQYPAPTVSFADKPKIIGDGALRQARVYVDWTGLSDVEKVGTDYALSVAYSSSVDMRSQVVNMASYKGYDSTYTGYSLFRPQNANNPYGPRTFILPVCTIIPQYAWYQYAGTDLSFTIGSIGHAVTESKSRPFGSTTNASGTVTIYTDGTHLDSVKAAVEDSAGSNLTFVYKASENTTYNGTNYSAGDTITV